MPLRLAWTSAAGTVADMRERSDLVSLRMAIENAIPLSARRYDEAVCEAPETAARIRFALHLSHGQTRTCRLPQPALTYLAPRILLPRSNLRYETRPEVSAWAREIRPMGDSLIVGLLVGAAPERSVRPDFYHGHGVSPFSGCGFVALGHERFVH